MNTVQHYLHDMEVNQFQLRDALRAILHTILFNRALGPVKPEVVSLSAFDIKYVRIRNENNPEEGKAIHEKIESAISRFCDSIQLIGPDLYGGQLWLSFYEKQAKNTFFGTPEKLYWERWIIPVVLNKTNQKSTGDRRQLYEQRRQQETAKAAVHSNLFRIVKLVNDKGVSYIPPFKLSSEVSVTFDFEVSVPTQAAKSSGKSWFNNVLNAGPEGFLSF